MRLFSLLLLTAVSAPALSQPEACSRGADLSRQLDAARAELGDDHADVLAIAREIRDLQQAVLADHPDQTIEEICGVEAEPAADTNRRPDPNEMICRREQVTGSHRRREVCMTRAEREANSRETRDRIRERRGVSP